MDGGTLPTRLRYSPAAVDEDHQLRRCGFMFSLMINHSLHRCTRLVGHDGSHEWSLVDEEHDWRTR